MNKLFKKFFKRTNRFPVSLQKGVYTTKFVINKNAPITLVTHELDGDWQFLSNDPIGDYKETGMLVSLEEMISKDRSVNKIGHLPIGYKATRKSRNDEWIIEKISYSESEMEEFGFYCSSCDLYHKELPMTYAADGPEEFYEIPQNERNIRSDITQDTYVLDEKSFFIKGQIKIPVSNHEDDFAWNVWIKINEEDFLKEQEQWFDENRFLAKPYFGILDTELTCYPKTRGLKVILHTQKVGIIPKVELEESNHPLFLEQESGINLERVIEFAKKLVYGHF